MEKHINIVAALQIGYSIFGIIIGLLVFTILYFVGDIANDNEAQYILAIVAKIIVVFVVLISLPGIIAGIGLFKRKEWARILTLIVSVLNLFSIPFGTAVGVYSIWTLVQPETMEQFK
ncbi:MAG: hypothetical protein HN778_19080 [Prolixibacteraceae bacterium]|jgi:hypothetical protein|nr:hypothetical protein [Prolixibacteraceae bacterium]MBT6004691.1 hypothetical protein [Prolixibacteraceae bacterium]MBT6765613.1 hypothetical protein [Prolixibacteraceae bacterium]MBT7000071.1 hypothetical protein [Prolixibacteraceae bacterium]MBT7396941.1 hypothetical protein [Prolixibacteraceae bacterium]